MKTKEEVEEKLCALKKILKETLETRYEYVDKKIRVASIKSEIELLEWILK